MRPFSYAAPGGKPPEVITRRPNSENMTGSVDSSASQGSVVPPPPPPREAFTSNAPSVPGNLPGQGTAVPPPPPPRDNPQSTPPPLPPQVASSGVCGSPPVPPPPAQDDNTPPPLPVHLVLPPTPAQTGGVSVSHPGAMPPSPAESLDVSKPTSFQRIGAGTGLHGEVTFAHVDAAEHYEDGGLARGVLYLTNYRVFFRRKDSGRTRILPFEAPLGTIVGVKRKKKTIDQKIGAGKVVDSLKLVCADCRNARFAFDNETECARIVQSVEGILKALSPHTVFAYGHKKRGQNDEGWKTYSPSAEYKRLGITDNWRLCNCNHEYKLCSSYPELLCIPSNITADDLDAASKYRSKGRIPVLSWIHPGNRAALTRSSQPMAGLRQKTSKEDEKMIRAIAEAAENPLKKGIIIVDARPRINAAANMGKGAGFEDTVRNYENCSIEFMGIDNIHVMRASYEKVHKICASYPKHEATWLADLESTNWLSHIALILKSALFIVANMDKEGTSVLVHCSDGWDRTPQLTATAQLLMDPYYRTMSGFQVLIEKEWLSFGHKFGDRCGIGEFNPESKEKSPIFVQWMDCIYQIMCQFPCSFEFQDSYLIAILDHLYSCRYGTFLFNCPMEREKASISTRTLSLWTDMEAHLPRFENPFFDPNENVLYPVPSIVHMKFWNNYYLRWDPRIRKFGRVEPVCMGLKKEMMDLREKVDTLNPMLFPLQELQGTIDDICSGIDQTQSARLALRRLSDLTLRDDDMIHQQIDQSKRGSVTSWSAQRAEERRKEMNVLLEKHSRDVICELIVVELVESIFGYPAGSGDMGHRSAADSDSSYRSLGLRRQSSNSSIETPTTNVQLIGSPRTEQARPQSAAWVPDSFAVRCSGCTAKFNFWRRRHHCRNCGKVFCGQCAGTKWPLRATFHKHPVRVCNRCLRTHLIADQSTSVGEASILAEESSFDF